VLPKSDLYHQQTHLLSSDIKRTADTFGKFIDFKIIFGFWGFKNIFVVNCVPDIKITHD